MNIHTRTEKVSSSLLDCFFLTNQPIPGSVIVSFANSPCFGIDTPVEVKNSTVPPVEKFGVVSGVGLEGIIRYESKKVSFHICPSENCTIEYKYEEKPMEPFTKYTRVKVSNTEEKDRVESFLALKYDLPLGNTHGYSGKFPFIGINADKNWITGFPTPGGNPVISFVEFLDRFPAFGVKKSEKTDNLETLHKPNSISRKPHSAIEKWEDASVLDEELTLDELGKRVNLRKCLTPKKQSPYDNNLSLLEQVNPLKKLPKSLINVAVKISDDKDANIVAKIASKYHFKPEYSRFNDDLKNKYIVFSEYGHYFKCNVKNTKAFKIMTIDELIGFDRYYKE